MIEITLQIKGPSTQETREIKLIPNQVFTVGRRDCNLNLEDPKVSKRHLSLTLEAEDLVVDDLGSHNGTFYNGEKIATQRIEEGGLLEIGNHQITFQKIQKMESSNQSTSFSGDSLDVSKPEYIFYRNSKLDWSDIKNTYLLALKNLSTFWSSLNFKVPFEKSLPILCVLALGYGLLGAIHNRGNYGLFALGSLTASNIGLIVIFSALLSALGSWLKLKGDFESYITFGVYLDFLYFPVALITTLFKAQVFFLIWILFALWSIAGFIKVFEPEFKKFVLILLGFLISISSVIAAVVFFLYHWMNKG